MGLLKGFLESENKSVDDMIMSPCRTYGIIQTDSSARRWLDKQEGITKLDSIGIVDLRSKMNPWRFVEVVFLFMGYGFGDVEEHLEAYYLEDDVMFFTIEYSGIFVVLAPIIDTSSNNGGKRS